MHECLIVSRRLQFVFKQSHLKLHLLKLCERATSLEGKAASLGGHQPIWEEDRPVSKHKRSVLKDSDQPWREATSLERKATSLGGKAINLVLRGGDQSNGRRPKYSIQLLQIDLFQYNRKSPSKKLVGRLSLRCSVMVRGLLPPRFLVAGPLSALPGLWYF
jgi:hypothetical protein